MDFDVKSSELLRKTLPVYLAELYEYDLQDESKDVFHEIGIHGYVCMYALDYEYECGKIFP